MCEDRIPGIIVAARLRRPVAAAIMIVAAIAPPAHSQQVGTKQPSTKAAQKNTAQKAKITVAPNAAAKPAKKRPPDPLDGPPFVTARSWAIADGKTGQVLWGHDAAKPVDIASTTKIMTAFVVLRLAASEPGRSG